MKRQFQKATKTLKVYSPFSHFLFSIVLNRLFIACGYIYFCVIYMESKIMHMICFISYMKMLITVALSVIERLGILEIITEDSSLKSEGVLSSRK